MGNIILPDNFHADFFQKITNTKQKVLEYRGDVFFSNKNHFKWRYLEPTQKEVCSNEEEILIVDHDLEQVSRYLVTKGFNIGAILKKAKKYRPQIYVANFENKKYTIKVDKREKLHSIAYFDNLDNKVQILFTNMKYTKGNIAQKKMLCNYPKSYDIIEG